MRRITGNILFLLLLFCCISAAGQETNFYFFKSGLESKNEGDYETAIEDFSIFIGHNPDYAKAYYYRGYSYFNLGNFENALGDFLQLAELDEKNVEAFYSAGRTYYELKQYDKAIEYFSTALSIDPFHVPSMNDRGMSKCFQNRFYDALEDFYLAVKTDSSFAMAYCNAGAARYFSQDIAKPVKRDLEICKSWFDKAIQKDPGLYLAYFNRAAVNYFLEDYKSAISDLNSSLRILPTHAMGYFYLGLSYAADGQAFRALAELNKAILLDPKLHYAYEEMGQIHFRNENYSDALKAFELAKSADPGSDPVYLGLMDYYIARLWAKQGNSIKMYEALYRAKKSGLFSDRKVLREFQNAEEFRKFRKEKEFDKFEKSVGKGKKDDKFLSPQLRWFRMQAGS